MQPRRVSGFTLIEILVVMVILGIVATFAVVSIHSPRALQTANFAEQLKMTVELAREDAILQPEVLGLTFSKDRYQFFRYRISFDPDRGIESTWEPITDDPLLRGGPIPDFLQVELTLDKTVKEHALTPTVVFSTNGAITPFTVLTSLDDKSPRYQLSAQQNGDIVLTKLPPVIPAK